MHIDEVARTRLGSNQAAALQQVIGLKHGRRTDAVGLAGIAHRRHALAGAEHPAANQFSNIVGEFFVAFHWIGLGPA